MLTAMLSVPGTTQVSRSGLGVQPDQLNTAKPGDGWAVSVTGPVIAALQVPPLSLQSMPPPVTVPDATSMRTMSVWAGGVGGPAWKVMLTAVLAVPGTVHVSWSSLGVQPDQLATL